MGQNLESVQLDALVFGFKFLLQDGLSLDPGLGTRNVAGTLWGR